MSNKFETFGKYVLLEKLATGGMAEVFLARGSGASGIAKFFAIKRILPQFSENPEFVDMFKNEAKIAINLKHSNIVSIHEYDEERGTFYIAMDYVEGRNLRQILNKMKKSGLSFSVEQAVFLIKEAAAGLDHAHHCIDGATGKPLNITHRDMSPQNIMVSFDGEVKIVDFGIAKAEIQIESTRAGTLKGKFGYMSPEQAEGQAVDLRTDIFSLGICLWELLAQDRLFIANNEINTLRKIRDCQVPSLRKINPNIHSELERITMKALTRDRNLRYPTCAALHRDLNRFLNRQYPDFTPQDFSVFVKSVFADEIITLRRRLIEYSKANPESVRPPVAISLDTTNGTSHNLMNTQTDSIVTGADKEPDTSTKSLVTLDDKRLSVKGRPHPSTKISDSSSEETKIESSGAITLGSGPTATGVDPSKAGPSENETRVAPLPLRIDEAATNKSWEPVFAPEENEASIPSVPDITSPSISRERGSGRGGHAPQSRSPNRGLSVGGLLLSLILLFAGYVGLAKIYPSQMSSVIAQLDPVLAPVHQAVGIARETERASTENRTTRDTEPKIKPPPPLPEVAHEVSLLVTSSPSGADILIDNIKTGVITPSLVQVPTDRPFRLIIRKKGYLDYTREKVLRSDLGDKFEATLIERLVGYLDVDATPRNIGTLYINNQAVSANLPLRNYEVPANVELKLRFVDDKQASSDEQIVTVSPRKKRSVQLKVNWRH